MANSSVHQFMSSEVSEHGKCSEAVSHSLPAKSVLSKKREKYSDFIVESRDLELCWVLILPRRLANRATTGNLS